MKSIINVAAAAAFCFTLAACSSETTTTTSSADSTTVPADNTGTGISGGDLNTADTTGMGVQPLPSNGDTAMMVR